MINVNQSIVHKRGGVGMFKNPMNKVFLILAIILIVFTTSTHAADLAMKGFIVEDRFVVPLRAIFEALGAEVEWSSETRTVTGTKGENSVKLTIDSKSVYINGKKIELDVPATIIDERTYVPARFVSESLGANVTWNPENKVAVIHQEGKIIVVAENMEQSNRKIIVGSTADSGTGTLRYAFQEAKPGDVITFDPSVFPFNKPATIFLTKALPPMTQGYLIVDGSEAGVIIDGSRIQVSGESISGLDIYSDGNIIQGFQILNFQSGAGIHLGNGSEYNKIADNVLSRNNIGILIETLDDRETSFNTIIGNFIGTDPTGKMDWGNKSNGIHINFGSHNVIGPNNIIAFNDENGILLSGPASVANTITRNGIFDNNDNGIQMNSMPMSHVAGNSTLTVPIILDFDLSLGTVKGYAFSESTVEIFSESTNEGEIYEGKTNADENGYFVFQKGAPMAGPFLTATTTDEDGYSSPFSAPTFGAQRKYEFQTGNNTAQNLIKTQSIYELKNNRIGSTLYLLNRKTYQEEIDGIPGVTNMWLDRVSDRNMKWQRVCLIPIEWENTSDENFSLYDPYSRQEISHYQKDGIRLLADNGVTITLTIVHWDEALHSNRPPDYSMEDDVSSYLEYAGFLVRNLKDNVDYWEILNEAVHFVELEYYLELIRRTVPVILKEDPNAKIVVGGSSILLYPEYKDYLFGVLESDVMPLVDGIVIHSMYGPSPQYDVTREYYYEYPELIRKIKSVAESNGFEGEYFADEMSWRTEHNRHFAEVWEYSEIQAAKYYGRGIVMNQGMDFWTGIGEEDVQPIQQMVRNLGIILSGAVPIDINTEIKVDYSGPVSYCAFKYPDGDRMLAIWTDASARNDDPSYSSSIEFSELITSSVSLIDPLYGIEQKLIFGLEGSSTVVQNLLVKDYPIFIRLDNPNMSLNYKESLGDGFYHIVEQ